MSSWKGFGLLILAAVLAVGAGGLAYLYVQGSSNRPAAQGDMVPVVVATKDITFATKLSDEHMKVVEFPQDAVPTGYYSDPDSVMNQTTKVFLVSGEPILASKMSSVGGGLSVRVPESLRASSVDVNEVSGVSGFVLPGDRVDVLCTIDHAPDQGNNVAVTKTIVQNVEVLAAGVKQTTNKNDPIKVQSVTLLVSPTQAEDLALGMHEGKIHLVLRNPVDHEIVEVTPTDTRTVFGLNKPKPKTTSRPTRRRAPPPPPPAAVEEPTYTIIRGGSIEKQKSPTEEAGSRQ